MSCSGAITPSSQPEHFVQGELIKQGEEGTPVAEIRSKVGISPATYISWKDEYAGLLPTEMKRIKQLEDENGRLEKIVADLTPDREMLPDLIRRKICSLIARANWFAGCAAIVQCRSGRLVGHRFRLLDVSLQIPSHLSVELLSASWAFSRAM